MRSIRALLAGFALLVLLVLGGTAAIVGVDLGGDDVALPDVSLPRDVDLSVPELPGGLSTSTTATPTSTTTTSTTGAPTTTTTPTAETVSPVLAPRYTRRSGSVGDSLTLGDLADNTITVTLVGIADPGEPTVPGDTRRLRLFVTYVFHGPEPTTASPPAGTVPRGFGVVDTLGGWHGPAAAVDDCDASMAHPRTPGVPVSACVPVEVPGSVPVLAATWHLVADGGATDPDLSWIRR